VRDARTAGLALLLLGGLGAGLWTQHAWPDSHTRLDCAPEAVRWVGEGTGAHAWCGPGAPPPDAIAVALGQRLSLNRAAEADLARLPGVGPRLARALIAARPLRTWDQVDAVPGVGPARLATLRDRTTLDP
jgi:competence protein ComEA